VAAVSGGPRVVLVVMLALLRAGGARAQDDAPSSEPHDSEAPPTNPTITLSPEQTVFAAPGGETLVRIEVTGAAVASLPRVSSTAGHIDDLKRVGAHSFEARFYAGEVRFPQAAIIGAETEEPRARGFTTVALCAPAHPAFRTKPGGKVSVLVGGRQFGPITAGPEGELRVPIVVPPGISTARARVADPSGLVSERQIDLHPPAFPRLLLLAPPGLPAGGSVEVGLVGIEADGQPVDESRLVLRSSYLRPHPLGARDHVARYLVRVPPQLDAGPLRLTAFLRPATGRGLAEGSEDRDDVDTLAVYLPVNPGPLARLALTPRRSRLVLEGADLWGHPVSVDGVEIFVDGRPARLERTSDGDAVVTRSSAAGLHAGPVEVEAMLRGIYARYRLQPGDSQGEVAAPAPRTRHHGTLLAALGALLPRGPGYGIAAHLDAESTRAPLPPAWRPGVGVGYLGMRTEAGDGVDQSSFTLDELFLLARMRWRRQLRAGIEVGAAAGLGVAFAHLRTHVGSVPLAGNDVGPAFELAAEVAWPVGPGALALGARYLRVPLGAMPGGDTVDGFGGGLVFDLGYRVGF
jgi:hypothetical protein